jgi:hypothetical protein
MSISSETLPVNEPCRAAGDKRMHLLGNRVDIDQMVKYCPMESTAA